MGDKNNPDVGGDREDCSQQSPGPVPPPEAFQQLERLHRSQDPNVQDSNKHNGQEGQRATRDKRRIGSNNENSNASTEETFFADATTPVLFVWTTSLSKQEPSL
jgi:hypothetical protein